MYVCMNLKSAAYSGFAICEGVTPHNPISPRSTTPVHLLQQIPMKRKICDAKLHSRPYLRAKFSEALTSSNGEPIFC